MVICRFYQAGRCKYGNNCKFEHIDPPGGTASGGGGFGGGGGGGSFGGYDPFSTPTKGRSASFRATDDTPEWPLSARAIKDHPEQGNIVEGDVSPEELRLQAYQMAPRGLSPEVNSRENQLVAEHQAKINAALGAGLSMPGNASVDMQAKDPFAQSASPQQQSTFGGGGPFGMGTTNGAASQQQPTSFGQVPQQMPQQAPPQGGNPFAQNFGFTPQQQEPVQSSAPPPNPAQEAQFSAAQFGFGKIPEAAPPPKYY